MSDEPNEAQFADAQWWLAPKGEKHEAVTRVVKQIRQNQQYRKLNDLLHASLYGNMPITGFGWGAYARPMAAIQSRLALNVVRNMVGAVTSKIAAKSRPKPSFQVEGGDWDLKQRAEGLEKFVSGVLYESKFYQRTYVTAFRDACVFGTGIAKPYAGNGRVNIERVLTWELVVDDGEAIDGDPPNIYQRKYWDRRVLIAVAKRNWGLTEEQERVLRHAKIDQDDTEFGYQTTADQVLVTEAWHRESEPGADDGCHAIVVEGVTLVDERWEGPIPIVCLRWSKPLFGYFGTGLAEELAGIQAEINKLLLEIQRGHHLIKGHYLVEAGSKVVSAHLNNDLAALVRYTGTPPQYQAPSIISPEVYQHLWNLYAKAFEITGISQLAAQSQKPAGLDAAVAIEAFNDIQSERFQEIGQECEEFVLEMARHVVRCGKQLGAGYKVKASDKNTARTIAWKDVDLDEDSYVLKLYPTSMLPTTPAGKRQWVSDMLKLGSMPPEDVLDAVDMPDTEGITKRLNAQRRLIEQRISKMFKDDVYITPEPFDDHQLALRLVNQMYAEAQVDGRPEGQLEMLRRYMTDTANFLKPPPAPAAPPGAGPPPGAMPPPPMPGAPPAPPIAVAPAGSPV